MRTPTAEQQSVIDSPARVRVVRAAPGSGKTWLVAELIRQKLDSWLEEGDGLAALSFTRVGGNEIRKATDYDLCHPHFVGTIDAFLFRYVVRPFLQRARIGNAAPRLIPAELNPSSWTKRPGGMDWVHRGSGGANGQAYNMFEVCFVGEDAGGPILALPRRYQGGMEKVVATDRAGLLAAKRRMWRQLGWLTHADAAFLASELLCDPTHGATIKAALLRRFSLLIVDELQDTGYFLGKCIRLLLDVPSSQGVLVGDPDQAIYEFNGAQPDLFSSFEAIQGAVSYTLSRSQRCPAAVTTCASFLKETPGQIHPVVGVAGRAILVRYGDFAADVKRLLGAVSQACAAETLKVIVRLNSTAAELTSGKGDEIRKLRCPALTHMAVAVQYFRRGKQTRALAAAKASIELAVFGEEGLTDEHIQAKGIDAREWREFAVRCLLEADTVDSALSMQSWQTTVGVMLDRSLQRFGLPTSVQYISGRLKPNNLTGDSRVKAKADTPFGYFAPRLATNAEGAGHFSVETVHAVKGETHDVTVFVCPNVSQVARCPSTVWWSMEAAHREERRIAYVAMTRSRKDLVLCVSEACYQRLCRERTEFVASFECKSMEECIALFASNERRNCRE